MFVLLAHFRVKSHVAGLIVVVVTCLLSTVIWRFPVWLALNTLLWGSASGVFPVSYIILGSIFLYNLVVAGDQVRVMRQTLEMITRDRRLQAILIAFGFGALLDASAGFLTPVTVSTSILVALGFEPLQAAEVSLVGCMLPAVMGAMGVPLVVTAKVTGIDPVAVGRAVGGQVPFLFLFVPFIIATIVGGLRNLRDVWAHAAVAGGVYGCALVVLSRAGAVHTAGLIAAISCLGAFVAFCRVRPPARLFGSAGDDPALGADRVEMRNARQAWAPFIMLAALVTCWNLPAVTRCLDRFSFTMVFRALQGMYRLPPAVPVASPVEATMTINLGSSSGTAILIAALLTAVCYKIPTRTVGEVFKRTARQLGPAFLTMATVFGAAYVLNYSGMAIALGVALSVSGLAFGAVAPVVTALGAFLTGSNTASAAMFSGLLVASANKIGMPQGLVLAAGSAGAVLGKMISPQCLAAATGAGDIAGQEGVLLSRVAVWAGLLIALEGIFVTAQFLATRA
jgi:lactate permease